MAILAAWFSEGIVESVDKKQVNEATIRSGLTYEHRFFRHVYLLFRGRISNPINTRLVEKNSKSSDYILTTKRDGSMYFNVGLSYNLF